MEIPNKSLELLLSSDRGSLDNLLILNILDSMSDSLLVFGQDGAVLYANKITKDILGYSLDDFKHKGACRLFFMTENNYDFNQIIADAVWKKSINEYSEVDYHHPDGSIRKLTITTSYLLADTEYESIFIGFVALFKDITEISNLRRKEKELTEEKNRIAKEKINSLHKLAMGVAHEIRNPMVTIGGFAARILRDMTNSEETRRYAESILDDARKLEKVVDKIQQYSNLPEPKFGNVDLQESVGQIISQARDCAAAKGVEIRFQSSLPAHCEARIDPTLLKIAVMNVLENAIDFTGEGGTVHAAIRLAPEGIVLEIKDSGPGIKDKDKEFIFDPFFSTRVHRSGMGLALVDRIINEHGGRIEVDSSENRGTAVRIILPTG